MKTILCSDILDYMTLKDPIFGYRVNKFFHYGCSESKTFDVMQFVLCNKSRKCFPVSLDVKGNGYCERFYPVAYKVCGDSLNDHADEIFVSKNYEDFWHRYTYTRRTMFPNYSTSINSSTKLLPLHYEDINHIK